MTGPFLVNSSLAIINRELGAALLSAADFDVSLEPHGWAFIPARSAPHGNLISRGLGRCVAQLELTIRHHWPPDFRRPARGNLAIIVPWEFGAAPRKWVEQIEQNVDELWVPSEFVRRVFTEGGVSAERIHVIPNGIDTEVFRPDGIRWRPPGCRSFAFLFVGGAIPRKGVDLLIKAYQLAFRAPDDVSLIINDLGSTTFYRHMSLLTDIQKQSHTPNSPHVVIVREAMTDSGLAALYRGSDVFVMPYRGEGFGMPIAEAMACGKPVITTC